MIMPWEKAGMKNKCEGCKYVVDTGEEGPLKYGCYIDYGKCFEGHRWEPNDEVAELLQASEAKHDTGKLRYDLVSPELIEAVVYVRSGGMQKHIESNEG